jgi:hypothetical protein
LTRVRETEETCLLEQSWDGSIVAAPTSLPPLFLPINTEGGSTRREDRAKKRKRREERKKERKNRER